VSDGLNGKQRGVLLVAALGILHTSMVPLGPV
jgi:hypothetical protein